MRMEYTRGNKFDKNINKYHKRINYKLNFDIMILLQGKDMKKNKKNILKRLVTTEKYHFYTIT